MILQNPKSLINAPLVFLILFTHMSYLDALDKVDGASGLDCVQLGQHFARVGRQGDQDAELGEGHQAHRRLGVGPQLRLDRDTYLHTRIMMITGHLLPATYSLIDFLQIFLWPCLDY